MSVSLTAERVHALYRDACVAVTPLDAPDESLSGNGLTVVDGVRLRFLFDRSAVQAADAEIAALLAELPDQFRLASSGGGWSFLNACFDRHGIQWGEHEDVERLFALGMAVGRVRCLLPRELWDALPGGMPYYAVVEPAP